MTVDPTVLPGLLLLALELLALAAVGFIVARVALRQADDRMALAQGMVIGPAVWGLTVNFILYLVPGRAGAIVGWVVVLALAFGLIKKASKTPIVSPRTIAGFLAASLAIFWIMLAARQLLKIPDPGIHQKYPTQEFIWVYLHILEPAGGRQLLLGTQTFVFSITMASTCLSDY